MPDQTKPTSGNIPWANSVARCWTKNLNRFKLKPTSSSIIQPSVQTRPTCCIQQCCMLLDQHVAWLCLTRLYDSTAGVLFTRVLARFLRMIQRKLTGNSVNIHCMIGAQKGDDALTVKRGVTLGRVTWFLPRELYLS